MLRGNGMGDASDFVNGLDGLMDGDAHARNSFGLTLAQPQYPQPVPTPSNSLAWRQMNRVQTNPRTNFDGLVDA
jgi:heat shock transcription factor